MSKMHSVHEPARIPLAQLPTPLIRLERLSRLKGAEIWLKRDDLTGLELSGNKIRKLEYIAADAIAQGCDCLVTEGTPQSNHCRATAAVCAKLGLTCVLLTRPEPSGPAAGNLWLNQLLGAEIRPFPRPYFDEHREELVERVMGELRLSGRKPRWIPMGASEPLGCWGYIRCAGELATQLRESGIASCDLAVAVSSVGTFAGLALGARLYDLPAALHGILVSDSIEFQSRAIEALCAQAIAQFGLPVEAAGGSYRLWDSYIGPGYAKFYPQVHETIREVARTEGIMLDPVYTAKAFLGTLELIREGKLGRDRPVVFIHTGGVFSAFAWAGEILGSGSV